VKRSHWPEHSAPVQGLVPVRAQEPARGSEPRWALGSVEDCWERSPHDVAQKLWMRTAEPLQD